jgi:hypothetical protein
VGGARRSQSQSSLAISVAALLLAALTEEGPEAS